MATALQLAFADHVHELDSGKRNGGRPKRFESPYRPGHSFDRPVILLDDIILKTAIGTVEIEGIHNLSTT